MRIDRLELQNFKKFKEASFEFPRVATKYGDQGSVHILIGENGTGKTSVLDARASAHSAGNRKSGMIYVLVFTYCAFQQENKRVFALLS